MRRCLSDYLAAGGIKKTVYPRRGVLQKLSAGFVAIFLRWKEYTQDSSAVKLMTTKVKSLHRIRVLEKCFWSIRTNISLKRSYLMRKDYHCFAYTRALADMEQLSKRFFAIRRRSLTYTVRNYQHKVQRLLRKVARNDISFKRFVREVKDDVGNRLLTEQKLLLNAFESRGTAQYRDVRVNSKMNKPPGEKFSDPRILTKRVDVPPGYLISKIKIAVQSGMGIVGWQLFWGADGCSLMEGTPRGKLIGSGITESEHVMKPHDYLMEVEYVSEGTVMTGIRFRSFFGNWSKYYGSKPNQLSKKFLLSSNMATLENGEQPWQAAGRLEEMYPGQPAHYIIGFGGIETSVRCTCLNVVSRVIIQHNIFTYHFVADAANVLKRQRSDISVEDDIVDEKEFELPPVTSATPSSRPSSSNRAIGIRNAKLAKHLADLQELGLNQDSDDDILGIPPLQLTPAEEQFFDVIRMRTVEVKAAQARALDFARSLWTSMTMRNSSCKSLTGIVVLKGLVRWFLEGLCKTLVRCPPGSEVATEMYAEVHSLQLQAEVLDNRILSYDNSIHAWQASERFKPWYGKALLGPQLRESKKVFLDELQAMKDVRSDFADRRRIITDQIEKLQDAALLVLPKFQLSQTVCKNFRLKIAAARYKSNLLEKMTLDSLKEHLGRGKGNFSNYTFQLSGLDMERIRQNKQLNDSLDEAVSAMDSLFEQDEALKHTKQVRQEMYAKGGIVSFAHGHTSVTPSRGRDSVFTPQSQSSKVPNTEANRILTKSDFSHTQTQRKTFRKFVAVNPVMGSVSKRPSKQTQKPMLSKTMPPLGSRSLRSLTVADESS